MYTFVKIFFLLHISVSLWKQEWPTKYRLSLSHQVDLKVILFLMKRSQKNFWAEKPWVWYFSFGWIRKFVKSQWASHYILCVKMFWQKSSQMMGKQEKMSIIISTFTPAKWEKNFLLISHIIHETTYLNTIKSNLCVKICFLSCNM